MRTLSTPHTEPPGRKPLTLFPSWVGPVVPLEVPSALLLVSPFPRRELADPRFASRFEWVKETLPLPWGGVSFRPSPPSIDSRNTFVKPSPPDAEE